MSTRISGKGRKVVLSIVGVGLAVIAIAAVSSAVSKGGAVASAAGDQPTTTVTMTAPPLVRTVPTTVTSTAAPVTRTVEAASTVNSTACEAALDAAEDLDGYLSDVAGIGAEIIDAMSDSDTYAMSDINDRLDVLTPKVTTARGALRSNSALCEASL